MNLLFFDIECASVYKTSAKICAFGYVLCDSEFNIIRKEDILINPKGKFHLTDGRGERGLVLPYKYDEFKKHPAFPQVYGTIKELLEDKNNLIFGHATINDVNYLNLETNRFRLPSFKFEYSDSQLMYMTAIGDFTRQFGLEYITADLNVDFTPHRAADDAYATMRVTQALCKKYNCSCEELGSILKIKKGKINNYRITKPDSISFSEYRKAAEAAKADRASRKHQFYCAVNCRHRRVGNKLKGQIFNFSREIEYNTEISIPLVEKIFANGGRYSQKLSLCNVYVCEDGDNTVRTNNAKNTEGLKITSVRQLTELLND